MKRKKEKKNVINVSNELTKVTTVNNIDGEFFTFKHGQCLQAHMMCETVNLLVSNFAKCSRIFTILSPANSTVHLY